MATYAAYKHVELYNVGSGKRRWISPFFFETFERQLEVDEKKLLGD